ncbi:MAG: O-antigen polymerase [Gemmatimonadales bacterium]
MTNAALLLSMVLLGMAAAFRVATGTWLHPAALFPMWWSFAAVLPLIVAHDEPVSPWAVAWVIVASAFVSAGAVAGNGGFVTRRTASPRAPGKLEKQLLSWPMTIALILGLGSSVAFALASGVSLADVTDIERLVVVSNQAYVARYADVAAPSPPGISQALLPFVYLAPVIGGMVFVLRHEWRWRLLALGTILPAIAVTVLQTTKAAVLFSVSLWLSSYFATRVRLGRLRVFTRGHLVVAVVLGVVTTVFFFAVGIARMASTDTSLAGIVRVKLITAAFGHMSVFSQWLGEYWNQAFTPTLGSYTFAGPLEMLGFKQRVPGIFENVVELIAGETSNIYTGFRPLIQDFTLPGALAILAVLGFVSGASFREVARGNTGAVPVLVAAYITILWTPITWFWIYNSLTATVVAVGLLVLAVRIVRGARRSAQLTTEGIVGTT